MTMAFSMTSIPYIAHLPSSVVIDLVLGTAFFNMDVDCLALRVSPVTGRPPKEGR
jgi:hypothetical protein